MNNLNLNSLKASLQANAPTQDTVVTTPHELRSPVTPTETEGVKFQHYKSAKISMRLISVLGTKIVFINHEFITADPDAIEYLNTEIARGLPGITKGALLTREEADPMSAIKKQWEVEFKAKQAEDIRKAALGESKDMGETNNKPTISPLGTSSISDNAAGS